jgi:hypothetical protein
MSWLLSLIMKCQASLKFLTLILLFTIEAEFLSQALETLYLTARMTSGYECYSTILSSYRKSLQALSLSNTDDIRNSPSLVRIERNNLGEVTDFQVVW